MKPIDKMTLPEVKEEIEKYAFVIDNSRLYSLLDQLDDLTRWIPVSERFPYEADAKGAEAIVWSNDGKYWKRITPPEVV
jgi:hypothetical protein